MLYAKTNNEDKSLATPFTKGICPFCLGDVIAKCGKINMWHWAHKNVDICDTWSDGETEWHLKWKNLFPKEQTEINIFHNGIKHRADVKLPNGKVIEFQHSHLSPDEIHEREKFYGNMIWIFDIRDSMIPKVESWSVSDDSSTFVYSCRFDIRDKGNYQTFRWKHPKKSISYTNCTVYLDLGNGKLFHLKKMSPTTPCGGWGNLISKNILIRNLSS